MSCEMSTACKLSFRSGRAERIVHAMEYTSAPLLLANTVIWDVEPQGLCSNSWRINSSSGRFLKKKVAKYCCLSAWRQTTSCKCIPYKTTGRKQRTESGRHNQICLPTRK